MNKLAKALSAVALASSLLVVGCSNDNEEKPKDEETTGDVQDEMTTDDETQDDGAVDESSDDSGKDGESSDEQN
ncbi:hypothetical protein [Bacillus sp. 165]|uniref:hypothetical protein n=1 Tax=Bacillus sp. 165 TaxID=1529117 RepID=UPI001ADC75A3|nr:hypothetical protein [Bacillus sp. 165]MBO9128119.1 hypothetical protein [Bacillus sp. 165]